MTNSTTGIDTEELQNGLYILKLTHNGEQATIKLVK